VARVLTTPSVGIHKNQPVGERALSSSCTPLNKHAPDVPHDLKVSKQLHSTQDIRHPLDSVTLMNANFSEEELTLHKGTILGVGQEISEDTSLSDEEDADRGTEQTFFLEAIRKYLRGLFALSTGSVMSPPLQSLISGIFSLFPLCLFTNLQNSDQDLPSFCRTEHKNVSCAFLFAVNNFLDSLFTSAWLCSPNFNKMSIKMENRYRHLY
jgi:hypothetical protein